MLKLDGSTLRRALQAHFDAGTLVKGRAYQQQQRVLECSVGPGADDGWVVAAAVRGSQRKPYEVHVDIFDSDGTLTIEGDCSCPMEFDCKHVAAALLRISEQPESWFAAAMAGNDLAPDSDGDLPELANQAARASRRLTPAVQSWLTEINSAANGSDANEIASPADEEPERLLYILRPHVGIVKIETVVARRLKKGGYGQTRNYPFGQLLHHNGYGVARFVHPADTLLARKIALAQPTYNTYEMFLGGDSGAELLTELLATDRCHWRGSGRQHRPLRLAAARQATPVWKLESAGQQKPGFEVEPPATEVLNFSPPWFVDDATGECGPLETGLPASVAGAWLIAPQVSPDEAPLVLEEIARHADKVSLPLPQRIEVEIVSRVKPVPGLRLYSADLKRRYYAYGWAPRDANKLKSSLSFAEVEFDYAGTSVPGSFRAEEVECFADGKLRRVHRDLRTETRLVRGVLPIGLQPANQIIFDYELGVHAEALTFADQDDWMEFVHLSVPDLQQKGWRVNIEDSFQFRLATPEDWFTDAAPESAGNDWFGVELGVVVDGQKINLLPVLLKILQTDAHLLDAGELAEMSAAAMIPVPLEDGRKVLFPAGRARQMLGALLELLNPDSLNAKGRLRLPKLRVTELAGETDWRWLGASELRDLSARLKKFSGLKPVTPPANLHAELRPYQRDGLSWLQFLREYELAGVLADDMGLGKTVQTLAHLLVEKQSGRMDKPSLVIAPTSLMTNWRQEAERFAPDLRVLVLHGLDRKQHFERIADHDLIVTSYPLLPRDQAVLREQEFHCVILDEAQFIKNPKTQYAQIACALKARHRLCLTGTPMENHLGELWSLFHFLLPGFLGDGIRFNSIFRRPIEKGGDNERRRLLAKRVAPFILRRKKEEVVKELPPKTEIVQNVELTGTQRDLYESVRLAMHQRVKEEVGRKGLSRAHIIILDALLKLRQICCHPQLLSLPSARTVKESAKLELLMDLLPEMIEEGRRVLLFSQFTSMLAIIEAELGAKKIPYVLLTGDTRDRATPVQKFQAGEVPLFLISLKAGGTGLNLTAADTVIHYDPWWNPAVENQATDRAHRIGQDKKVFVYKLMTVGTVEEKIGAMQARKRELVEGLLNEERRDSVKLTNEDLDVLFAPLQ